MAIKSETGRGLIYAGDTPLAISIVIEHTGPMQLTVRAGSFTNTGQRRKDKLGEWLPWIEEPQTYTLVADQVLNLTSDLNFAKHYDIDLVSDGVTTDILIRSQLDDGIEEWSPYPVGWKQAHDLILPFTVPAGTADLANVDIYVWTVLLGFPVEMPSNEAHL